MEKNEKNEKNEKDEMIKFKFAAGATFVVEAKNYEDAVKMAEEVDVELVDLVFIDVVD